MPDGTDGPPPSELGITPQDMGLNPVPEPVVNDELTLRLREIDANVIDRHVMGKFPGEVILHGQSIGKPLGIDYGILPRDKDVRDLDPTHQFGALNNLVREGVYNPYPGYATELVKQLGNSHVFAFLEGQDNPDQATVQLIYPDELPEYHITRRPKLVLEVFLRMPTEFLKKLSNIVNQNPDALEQFYQITTSGLDQSVQRSKKSQVALINLNNFIPVERVQRLNLGRLVEGDGMTILQYTQPQGQLSQEEIVEIRTRINQEDAEARRLKEIAQKSKEVPSPAPTSQPASEPKGVVPAKSKESRHSMFEGGPLEGLPKLVKRIFGPKGK